MKPFNFQIGFVVIALACNAFAQRDQKLETDDRTESKKQTENDVNY